jgi:hypothetical protein
VCKAAAAGCGVSNTRRPGGGKSTRGTKERGVRWAVGCLFVVDSIDDAAEAVVGRVGLALRPTDGSRLTCRWLPPARPVICGRSGFVDAAGT